MATKYCYRRIYPFDQVAIGEAHAKHAEAMSKLDTGEPSKSARHGVQLSKTDAITVKQAVDADKALGKSGGKGSTSGGTRGKSATNRAADRRAVELTGRPLKLYRKQGFCVSWTLQWLRARARHVPEEKREAYLKEHFEDSVQRNALKYFDVVPPSEQSDAGVEARAEHAIAQDLGLKVSGRTTHKGLESVVGALLAPVSSRVGTVLRLNWNDGGAHHMGVTVTDQDESVRVNCFDPDGGEWVLRPCKDQSDKAGRELAAGVLDMLVAVIGSGVNRLYPKAPFEVRVFGLDG